MAMLLTTGKVIATMLLIMFLISGILKADPRTHNAENPRLAEYSAGFLICAFSIIGIVHMWF